MKRLAWLAGTAAVVLLIAAGVLLLLGNLYVQSPAVQTRIRRELSVQLKMPADARKTTLTPWDGLRIDGVMAPTDDPGNNNGAAAVPTRPHLVAKSFRARLALGPLILHRHLVVRDLLLDTPELSWAQTADGRWRWPRGESPPASAADRERNRPEKEKPERPVATPTASASAGTAAAATPSPTAASQQQEETPTPAPSVVAVNRGSSNAPVMIDVAIESFRLRHGSAQFLDAHGDVLSRLENVSLDGRVDPLPAPSVAGTTPLPQGDAATAAEKNTSRGGSGRLGCERATLRDWPAIVLTKFESAFTFRDRVLDLADGRAELAGGVAHGDFHLQTDEPGSPFRAHGRLENVSLGQLCKDLTLPGLPRFVAGRLNGTMEATGGSAGRTGKGQFRMADIQLQNLPLLQSVGDVLRIEELSQLRFKTAQFDCRVEGDTLVIEALSFVASHLRMEAHGSCQMLGGALADNVIDLQARLIVDPSVSKQLPAFVEDIFIPLENSTDGLRYLDFRISGPLGNPRNDLRDRVINRLPLQELLGGGSNNRESNNRRARGGATPTPSPSPTSGRRGGGNGNNNNRGGRPTPPTPPTPTPTPAAAAASPKAN